MGGCQSQQSKKIVGGAEGATATSAKALSSKTSTDTPRTLLVKDGGAATPAFSTPQQQQQQKQTDDNDLLVVTSASSDSTNTNNHLENPATDKDQKELEQLQQQQRRRQRRRKQRRKASRTSSAREPDGILPAMQEEGDENYYEDDDDENDDDYENDNDYYDESEGSNRGDDTASAGSVGSSNSRIRQRLMQLLKKTNSNNNNNNNNNDVETPPSTASTIATSTTLTTSTDTAASNKTSKNNITGSRKKNTMKTPTTANPSSSSSQLQPPHFTPLMRVSEPCHDNVIVEEPDPEAPSDEEDFHEEMQKIENQVEPGRLTPVKIQWAVRKGTPSPRSIQQRDIDPALFYKNNNNNNTNATNASMITQEQFNREQEEASESLHPMTLLRFKKLKLQAALADEEGQRLQRAQKLQDRVEDVRANKKLWQDFNQLQEQLSVNNSTTSSVNSKTNSKRSSRRRRRRRRKNKNNVDNGEGNDNDNNNENDDDNEDEEDNDEDGDEEDVTDWKDTDSFDLKNSETWYFDFQAKELSFEQRLAGDDDGFVPFQVDPTHFRSNNNNDNNKADNNDRHHDDDDASSQANLSLLSGSSMEAQRQYFREKRTQRKKKRRHNNNNNDKLQQQRNGGGGLPPLHQQQPRSLVDTPTQVQVQHNDYGPVRRTPRSVARSNGGGAGGSTASMPTQTPDNMEVEFVQQRGGAGMDNQSFVSYLSEDVSDTGGRSQNSRSHMSGSSYYYNDYGVDRTRRRLLRQQQQQQVAGSFPTETSTKDIEQWLDQLGTHRQASSSSTSRAVEELEKIVALQRQKELETTMSSNNNNDEETTDNKNETIDKSKNETVDFDDTNHDDEEYQHASHLTGSFDQVLHPGWANNSNSKTLQDPDDSDEEPVHDRSNYDAQEDLVHNSILVDNSLIGATSTETEPNESKSPLVNDTTNLVDETTEEINDHKDPLNGSSGNDKNMNDVSVDTDYDENFDLVRHGAPAMEEQYPTEVVETNDKEQTESDKKAETMTRKNAPSPVKNIRKAARITNMSTEDFLRIAEQNALLRIAHADGKAKVLDSTDDDDDEEAQPRIPGIGTATRHKAVTPDGVSSIVRYTLDNELDNEEEDDGPMDEVERRAEVHRLAVPESFSFEEEAAFETTVEEKEKQEQTDEVEVEQEQEKHHDQPVKSAVVSPPKTAQKPTITFGQVAQKKNSLAMLRGLEVGDDREGHRQQEQQQQDSTAPNAVTPSSSTTNLILAQRVEQQVNSVLSRYRSRDDGIRILPPLPPHSSSNNDDENNQDLMYENANSRACVPVPLISPPVSDMEQEAPDDELRRLYYSQVNHST